MRPEPQFQTEIFRPGSNPHLSRNTEQNKKSFKLKKKGNKSKHCVSAWQTQRITSVGRDRGGLREAPVPRPAPPPHAGCCCACPPGRASSGKARASLWQAPSPPVSPATLDLRSRCLSAPSAPHRGTGVCPSTLATGNPPLSCVGICLLPVSPTRASVSLGRQTSGRCCSPTAWHTASCRLAEVHWGQTLRRPLL